MLIREVEKLTGISSFTIRYYEKIGLLADIQRKASGTRDFSTANVNDLLFIATLKNTGMSLEDIIVFMQDGCILEKVNTGKIPYDTVSERVALLVKQQALLNDRKAELDTLTDALNQKLTYYNNLLQSEKRGPG
jgi:MerR family transcriptional regulator, aldehyde-responsive regulator